MHKLKHIVMVDEMNDPDALVSDGERMVDVTSQNEKVLHIAPNGISTVIVIWDYFYHRITATRISMHPEMQATKQELPAPVVSRGELLPDGYGVQFTVDPTKAKKSESWVLNVAVEGTYFNLQMGREYTHRRPVGLVISTKQPIDEYVTAKYV